MEYQVSARKHRPMTFAEVTGQTHVVRTLTNALASGHTAHAYLFSGMRGVAQGNEIKRVRAYIGVDTRMSRKRRYHGNARSFGIRLATICGEARNPKDCTFTDTRTTSCNVAFGVCATYTTIPGGNLLVSAGNNSSS